MCKLAQMVDGIKRTAYERMPSCVLAFSTLLKVTPSGSCCGGSLNRNCVPCRLKI
jgi:hypothetical protein